MAGVEAVRIIDSDGNDVDMKALVDGILSLGGSASAMTSARKVVSVTNTALAIGSAPCKVVFITALSTNSDLIVIGGSATVFTEATRTGKVMYAGDTITVAIDNLDSIFVNGTAGDGVSFAFTT